MGSDCLGQDLLDVGLTIDAGGTDQRVAVDRAGRTLAERIAAVRGAAVAGADRDDSLGEGGAGAGLPRLQVRQLLAVSSSAAWRAARASSLTQSGPLALERV